jgi:hypothetical protein
MNMRRMALLLCLLVVTSCSDDPGAGSKVDVGFGRGEPDARPSGDDDASADVSGPADAATGGPDLGSDGGPGPPDGSGMAVDAADDVSIGLDMPAVDTGGGAPFSEAESMPGTWVWVPVPETVCRDGSSAGFGVRLGTARRLVVVFQEGPICYDQATCSMARERVAPMAFVQWAGLRGDVGVTSGQIDNPVGAAHFVLVPDCIGDAHSGDRSDVAVTGLPGVHQFRGHHNAQAVMDLVAPYFSNLVDDVVLVGQGTGGFGASANYEQIRARFGSKTIAVLTDGAALVADDQVFAPCLQEQWRRLWGLNAVLPAGCTECAQQNGDGLSALLPYLATQNSSDHFALVSAVRDRSARNIFGAGQNMCSGGSMIPGGRFQAALLSYRDNALAPAGCLSFFYSGQQNGTTTTDRLYTGEYMGTLLSTWVADWLVGTATSVGP